MGTVVDSLIQAGFGGYAGWEDAEAQANFNATGGEGKKTGGGGDGSGSAIPPPFSFDYEAEAKKAYGELGAYYARLLTWAQGDMNKVLARLTEDYDRGLRVKKEDVAEANRDLDVTQDKSRTNIVDNALARGLYQKSNFASNGEQNDPFSGFGLPDVNFRKLDTDIADRREALSTNLTRYTEDADIRKSRITQDATEDLERDKFKMEEERKLRSGDIANERGSRAYQDYINKFSLA
jgi:hypothetical protein